MSLGKKKELMMSDGYYVRIWSLTLTCICFKSINYVYTYIISIYIYIDRLDVPTDSLRLHSTDGIFLA